MTWGFSGQRQGPPGPRRREDRREKGFPRLSYCQSSCAERSRTFQREKERPAAPPLEETFCPAHWLCPASQGGLSADPLPWELGGRVCAVFPALLTYSLFGTAGLGLHTVPLFVSTALQSVLLSKRHKGPLSSAGLRPRVVLQGLVSTPRPAPGTVRASVPRLSSRGLCLGVWPPWQAATPALKAAEPPGWAGPASLCPSLPAGVGLLSLEQGTRHARAWLASPRGL